MFTKLTARARALRSKWAAISFEKKVSMFVAPIVVAVATAVILPRISGGGGGHDVSPKPSDEQLEVSDLTVDNSSEVTKIDLAVRNIGGLVAVATKARFRILKFATLGACLPEAYLLPTHTYELVLPTEDAQGKTRDVSISQEIESNDSDRFTFDVGIDAERVSTVSYLYRLQVALFHDRKPTPIQAGEVWLAEPFPQEHWFSVPDDLGDAPEREEVEMCVDENKANLSAIYNGSASVSPELLDFAESVGLNK
jgi:hypothetical protein